MSLLSFETWENFETRFGVDPRFRQIGYAYFARNDATAKRLAEGVALQQRHGVRYADIVVNAAGGWSRLLACTAGAAFPLRSHRLPLLLVDTGQDLQPP